LGFQPWRGDLPFDLAQQLHGMLGWQRCDKRQEGLDRPLDMAATRGKNNACQFPAREDGNDRTGTGGVPPSVEGSKPTDTASPDPVGRVQTGGESGRQRERVPLEADLVQPPRGARGAGLVTIQRDDGRPARGEVDDLRRLGGRHGDPAGGARGEVGAATGGGGGGGEGQGVEDALDDDDVAG